MTLNANAGVGCPQVNPAGEHDGDGQRELPEVERLDAGSGACVAGPSDRVDSHGAFMAASPNITDSNPRSLVELTGAIVVAANYRIGPLGFMGHPALTAEDPAYHSSGNYGFLDQRAAMAWVRDNIAAFGGDRDNVTIAGQSAGGHSVSFHIVSPGSALYSTARLSRAGTCRQTADARRRRSVGQRFRRDRRVQRSRASACLHAGEDSGASPARFSQRRAGVRPDSAHRLGTGRRWSRNSGPARSLYKDGAFNRVPTIIGSTRDEGWIYADRSYPGGLTHSGL